MENSPDLIRSTLKPPRRRTTAIAIAIAGSAGLLTIGALIGKAVAGGSIVPVAAPVFVDVPEAPAPVVTVNVPPPPPAPPPPPELPAPPPAPPPRALSPHIDAACLVPADGTAEPSKACTWDRGFPAISGDGTLIAGLEHDFHPSGMGGDGVAIVFTDAKTSRLVRREVLLSQDRDYDFQEAQVKLRPGVQARLERQVAAVQRTLDAQAFRSLVLLGSNQDGDAPADAGKIRAEFDDNAARIVDPERSAVLWQGRFSAGWDDPKFDSATDLCGGGAFHSAMLWWDPTTRLVLADLAYTTGGCMCPTVGRTEVHHIPAEALAR